MFKIEFKPEVDCNDFRFLNWKILIIFLEFIKWCQENDYPVMVTSIKSDEVKGRTSNTHKEGRAIDISCRGFDTDSIDEVVHYINKKFPNMGAISSKDGASRAIIAHNSGSGIHFHLQCRP